MEIDIVTGLESGADDYITKPFSLAVLRAKVNAVARRFSGDENIFRSGSFSFDFENMKFFSGDEAVELSKTAAADFGGEQRADAAAGNAAGAGMDRRYGICG